MRMARICLLLAVAGLVVGSISGCLKLDASRPQAIFTGSPSEHVIPFTASFDGTLSEKASSDIASYLWNFGDGSGDTGPLVDHTYTNDGEYTVQLTVIDNQGVSSTSELTINALNPLPTASFTYTPKSSMDGEYIVGASEWITFDGSESCDDGDVVSYNWNFGDGEYATGVSVEHRYLYPGTYNVVLTVTDDDGGTSNYIEQINVLGGPPCNADITGDVSWTDGGTCQ
jgi:PKD repeat protein